MVITERVCPFCSAALVTASPRDPRLGRMSRAAVFAGAALASTACGGKQAKTDTTTGDTQEAAQQDAGVEEMTPPPPPHDPNNVPMPYGAPPARHRVV